jgi:phage baseplate assembly protein W
VINLELTAIKPDAATAAAIKRGHVYKDLRLDLESSYRYDNLPNNKLDISDLQAIYDIEAVKNSIRNAFLTSPGQRILSPRYGIDLRRYVFEQVDDSTAFFLAQDITEILPEFEPRITVRDVRVIPNPDENQYDIYLTIDVPSLDVYGLLLKNYLNSKGYY